MNNFIGDLGFYLQAKDFEDSPCAKTVHVTVCDFCNSGSLSSARALCGESGWTLHRSDCCAWTNVADDDPRPVCKRCIAALKKVAAFAEKLEQRNEGAAK